MNILYLHGYASQFDATHEKCVALGKLGTVFGIDLRYTDGYNAVMDQALAAIIEFDIDLVVGTSMGGYLAIEVANKVGIASVALNPAIFPSLSLEQFKDMTVDFAGNAIELTDSVRLAYPKLSTPISSLVAVDLADDIIDPNYTMHYINEVIAFPGGSHRFEHMDDMLPLIEEHMTLTMNYGF